MGRISTVFYQNERRHRRPVRPTRPPKASEAASSNPLGIAFKADPDAPIEIEAATLDVADPKKQAVYKGNVIAKQGEFVVQTAEMTAHYTGQTGLMTVAQPLPRAPRRSGAGQSIQLTRVEARQKVIVTGKDGQNAVGDWADFDVKANTVVMGGKVVVSQGKQVIDGDGARFIIDMTTGISRFEQTQVVVPATTAGEPKKPTVTASPPATGPSTASASARNAHRAHLQDRSGPCVLTRTRPRKPPRRRRTKLSRARASRC